MSAHINLKCRAAGNAPTVPAVVSEGQAVAWIYTSKLGNSYVTEKRSAATPEWSETPLYTRPAAPAPEAPDDRQAMSHAEMLVVVDPWPCAVSSDQIQQIVDRDTPPDNRNEVVDHDLTGKPITRGDVERFSKASPVAEAPTELTHSDDGFAQRMLATLDRMGASPEGLSLAAQLFGVGACSGCGFRKLYCRCAAPATEQAKSSRVTPKMRQAMDDAMEEVAGIAREVDALRAEVEASPAQAEQDTGARAISPPELPKFMPDFHFHSNEALWDHAVLTGWRAAQASPAKPDLAGLTPERIHEIADSINWANVEWDYVAQDAFAESLLAAITKEQK